MDKKTGHFFSIRRNGLFHILHNGFLYSITILPAQRDGIAAMKQDLTGAHPHLPHLAQIDQIPFVAADKFFRPQLLLDLEQCGPQTQRFFFIRQLNEHIMSHSLGIKDLLEPKDFHSPLWFPAKRSPTGAAPGQWPGPRYPSPPV